MENDLEFFEEKLMLPPAPGTFQDREELIKHVREFGACQGYVVTIKKSRKDRRVILGCDRGGVYRNRRKVDEGNRKRKANSRLINCPFEAIGKKDDDVWVLTIRNGEHNHEPLRDMSDHPYSRRFTEDEIRKIKQMTEAGVKPRQVLKALKQSNPELQSTPRHLYNLKAKIRQGKLSEKNFKSWRPDKSIPLSISIEESTKDTCLKKVPNYIGGKCGESEACEYIDVINPATQEVVSQVPVTTYDEFKAAVAAARQAFPAWRSTPVTARQRIMFKFQELIRRDIDKIVMNIAIEQGKTLNGAKGDVLRGLEVVEQSCGMVTLQMGEFIPNATSGVDTFCIREPLGVCAGICPLNLPAMISLWMFPIAVTCGNTFVLKPSVKNPGASMILAALAAEAGLPDGVLNVVHGTQEIINYICDDDDIKAISLVGSNSAGMDTYARAVTRGKRVQSNMGAKNHAIIMPDASADVTLDSIIASGFGAAGQRCMTLSTLIFVGGSAPWEKELVDRAKALKVNAGTEVGTDLGPVISKEAKDHICRLVQNGVERGARLLIDGRNVVVPKYENGNFLGPTILCGVSTDMECYKEEMFGPVLLCMQADNLEEAIAIVNRNRYGNGAAIFTTSGVAARKFQNDVESGLVGINVAVPIPLPFSTVNGSKASFAGDLNFCGKAGVQFYTLVKTIASQWRDLPSRRVAFPHPPTSEAKMSSRGVPLAQPLSCGSDLLGREVSAATTLASPKDLPSDNFYLPSSPPTSEVLPSTPPTREPELPRQDVSFIMPSTSERETMDPKVLLSFPSAGQSGSMALHSDSEGAYLQHTSQWGDSLSNSQGMIQSTDDLEDSERLYFPMSYSNDVAPIFLRNESLSPTSLRQDIQMTEMNSDPSSDTVYIPMMPQRTNNPGSALHETNTMLQMMPDKIYMPLLVSDGVGLMSLMSDATETGSLYMPVKPDDVCLTSEIGNEVVASASDRLFMPESSQGIYDQTSLLSTHDYRGQEISEHQPQPSP